MDIKERIEKVRQRIKDACRRADRSPEEITLVAVSKTKPPQLIVEAWKAGLKIFGENYVQELIEKAGVLKDSYGISPEWHFIGHLQRNKVKKLLPWVKVIHSVDSIRLVKTLEKEAAKIEKQIPVLIEVNIGNEPTKSGCTEEEVAIIIEEITKCRWVILKGLMCIPPWNPDPEMSRRYFIRLRELRDRLGGERLLPELSMGMTDDFEIAIEEGATIVRIGRAIFGERR